MPPDSTTVHAPFPAPWDALDPEQAARVAALTAAEQVLGSHDTHDLILVAGFILHGTVPWDTGTEAPDTTDPEDPRPFGDPYRVGRPAISSP